MFKHVVKIDVYTNNSKVGILQKDLMAFTKYFIKWYLKKSFSFLHNPFERFLDVTKNTYLIKNTNFLKITWH